jgi:DNA polymerase
MFSVCDFSAIEPRVGAWVSQCQSLLNGFQYTEDFDIYIDLATRWTGIPYTQMVKDKNSKNAKIKAEAKGHRQVAKPGFLGSLYGLGGGGIKVNKKGDIVKTGLYGYAEANGVKIEEERAHEIVKAFRTGYPDIPKCWYDLEALIKEVLEGVQTVRYIGPDNCIKIDKIYFEKQWILRIHLPSGRAIHYLNARLENCLMPWKAINPDGEEEDVYKLNLVYDSVDQETKQWGRTTSRGAKIFENIVQGIARDVLGAKMLELDKEGLTIDLHIHDEIGIESNLGRLKQMEEIMSSPIDWAPGLPLAAEGWTGNYYHK